MKKRVALHTLGCKLNYAETSMLGRQFVERGYEVVDDRSAADVYLLNTCSVTEHANRECRQIIRRMHRQSPGAAIVVVGCYAQLAPEQIAEIDGVDLILGAKEKFSVLDYLGRGGKNLRPEIHAGCIDDVHEFGPAYSTVAADRTRAFLKVQDGCDYTCSFCTIPMARGESRSQPVDVTVEQARELAGEGYREIVLTGVNVGDYGRKSETSLLDLLAALEEVRGLERIRISSIEPNLLTAELRAFIRGSSKVCRHFHVPLQSGHDDILKSMRRRYLTAGYADVIAAIRSDFPDAGIGADVIVGFPGETDAHFEATHAFLADVPLSYLHVFSYSARPNTPAARMSGAVDPAVRSRRSDALRALSIMKKRNFAGRFIGTTPGVLIESEIRDGMMEGFTENYLRVQVAADESAVNRILPVRLISYDHEKGVCRGEVVCE